MVDCGVGIEPPYMAFCCDARLSLLVWNLVMTALKICVEFAYMPIKRVSRMWLRPVYSSAPRKVIQTSALYW